MGPICHYALLQACSFLSDILQRNSLLCTNHLQDRLIFQKSRRGLDRMVVGFTTTCEISAYRH